VKISVIIPCYNQAQYLPDVLMSVQQQDYSDWEAIIVNDGSTDATETIANEFAAADKRIVVVTKPNGGLSSARNAGLKAATGHVYQFLDADDRVLAGCFQTIADHVAKHPEVYLFQTGYRYTYGLENNVLHATLPSERTHLLPGILKGNAGPVHSLFIRAEAAKAAGFFDETLRSAEDWDFWIRVAKSGYGTMQVIPLPLVDYRIVDDSMSRNAFVMYDALKTVLRRAPGIDKRITDESVYNKTYTVDSKPALKRMLMMCLGVSVMQGHIADSVALLKQEEDQEMLQFQERDFSAMCSYLSFRYRYDSEFTQFVLQKIRPRFDQFFNALGYRKAYRQQLLAEVFRYHLQINRRKRFGILAPIINRLANMKQRFL
jgi:glycosyltransferase involved in cell wall biosynthesis